MNGIQEVSGSIPLISTIGKLLKLVLTHIKTSFFCLLGDFSPSSVTAYGGATFPRQGGKAHRCVYRDHCAVKQVPVLEPSPSRGKVAGR